MGGVRLEDRVCTRVWEAGYRVFVCRYGEIIRWVRSERRGERIAVVSPPRGASTPQHFHPDRVDVVGTSAGTVRVAL